MTKARNKTATEREVEVYHTPSGLGGSYVVSILEELEDDRVKVRIWYGRATPTGWERWLDFDGATFVTERSKLTNRRMMPLFKEG